MDYNIIGFGVFVFVNLIVIFTKVYSYKKKEKSRLGTEVIRISRIYYPNVLSGFSYIIIPIIIIVPIAIKLAPRFMFLSNYFSNTLQWFNLVEIEKLRAYFFERNMVVELMRLLEYKKLLLNIIFVAIYMFIQAAISFYMSSRDIIIYEDGILIYEQISKWDDFRSFAWSEPFYSKLNKEKYCILTMTFKSEYNFMNKSKIRFKYEIKESVNNILTSNIKDIDEELQLKFLPFPLIQTKKLILRRIKLEDKNEIFNIKSNDEVLKYVDNKKHEYIEESEQYIMKINDGITNNEYIQWGITLKDSDKVIGTICLWNISKEDKTAEVGYDLMPDYQGKGIMQEALEAVIKYAFKLIKFKKLTAYTQRGNLKSINLLERNNFFLESEDSNYKMYNLNLI